MEIFELVKSGNIVALKELFANGTSPNVWTAGKQTPLHLAVLGGEKTRGCLELILNHINVRVDPQDDNGNTPLHLAVQRGDLESTRLLVNSGALVGVENNEAKAPIEYAKDDETKAFLVDKFNSSIDCRLATRLRSDQLNLIDAHLPDAIPALKKIVIEVVGAIQLFQDRCKETIYQLVEEKQILKHKFRLLENAAGIKDKDVARNFLGQLQFLETENEEFSATSAYWKIQTRMTEVSLARQDEFYRKSMVDMADQHGLEIKIMMERVEETEAHFLESQKQTSEEYATLELETLSLKQQISSGSARGSIKPERSPLPVDSASRPAVAENSALQQKIKDLNAEKMALAERLKSTEQLKNLHEQEVVKLRKDINDLRKGLQESMAKVLQEARTESDDQDEKAGKIVFVRGENNSKQLKGATMEKLVDLLTDPSSYDSQFQASFLLTFRSFMDATTFLSLLIKRFQEISSDINNPSLTTVQSTQSPVQLRVCNTLKNWLENYWYDFSENPPLVKTLTTFLENITKTNEKLSNVIRIPLNRKVAGQVDAQVAINYEKRNGQPRPKPLLPKALLKRVSNASPITGTVSCESVEKMSTSTLGRSDRSSYMSNWGGFNLSKGRLSEDRGDEMKLKFFDLDPLEIARQLTLIEYEMFTAIKPNEFLDQAWMKDDREVRSPNICNMTKWSNHVFTRVMVVIPQVTRWIVSEIVTVKDSIKSRALIYERVVSVAQNLEKMNNLNGVKEVLAALQSSSVYRLKKTRELVSAKFTKIMEDLVKLTSTDLNFKTLRAKIHTVDPPLIPFPGVYQGDLVFLDTCSRSKLENGLINFAKYQKIASYILELLVYQQTPYNFEPVMEIGNYVRNWQVLQDEESYCESLICEPRST